MPSGRVVIHDTACYGQRECGPGDHDQSCHWGSDAKYYCLRCVGCRPSFQHPKP